MKSKLSLFAGVLLGLTSAAQTVETVATGGLFEPYGVAVDLATNLYYFTDSARNRILRFDPVKQELKLLAGISGTSFTSGAWEGLVVRPEGLVVADQVDHALYAVSFDGAVSLVAGGVRGFEDGRGAAAKFHAPAGLAIDADGAIYVADLKNNAIRKVLPDRTVTTYAKGFFEPSGVAVDDQGRVFVADTRNHVIQLIERNGSVRVIAGRLGVASFVDGPGAVATFHLPRGLVWVGGETGLLVSDTGNNLIRRVRPAGESWRVESMAGGLDLAPGAANGAPFDARFNGPVGMALDGEGSILVADLYGQSLRRIRRAPATLPVVLPVGGSFSNDLTLAITSAIPRTLFRYTTDGNEPNPTSPSTQKQLTFRDGPVTLLVRGYSPDFATSATVSNAYRFFVDPLKVSIGGGTFSNDVPLQVVTRTLGAQVRISQTELPPETNSPIWTDRSWGITGPLQLQGFRDGFDSSVVASNYFTFVAAAPQVAPAGGSNTAPIQVAIGTETRGAELRWTIDGSDPTPASALYTGPFLLATNGVLHVRAFKEGYVPSLVSSNNYIFTVADPEVVAATGASDNDIVVRLQTATPGAQLVWRIGNHEPQTVTPPFTFPLGTNGVLTVTGYRDGFNRSVTVTNAFSLTVGDPAIAPAGATANNPVRVAIATTTAKARVYWTIDGSEPTPASALYTGPFVLGTNGVLKARAFKDGYVASATVSNVFNLAVGDLTIAPAGADSFNAVPVTLATVTTNARVYWTIDGSEPTPAAALYTGPFVLGTNGVLKARAFQDGFLASPVASAFFHLHVATPVVDRASGSSINRVAVSVATNATAGAQVVCTYDGSDPTPESPACPATLVLTTNTLFKVAAFRPGFLPSPVITREYRIQVDTPAMDPAGGFFPNGTEVRLGVSRPDAALYYTLNGVEPTTNDLRYAGPFVVDQLQIPGKDLRAVRVRAFAPLTDPSEVASGQPVQVNAVGVPRDLVAGPGSTVVVPVVLNLAPGREVRSLQFRVEVAPAVAGVPNLAIAPRVLPTTTNDFAALLVPAGGGGSSTQRFTTYDRPGPGGVVTNGVAVAFVGTNANLVAQDFSVPTLLAVSIPRGARAGQQYSLTVLEVSATTNAAQAAEPLIAMSPRMIQVKSVAYLVGDSSPGRWYNAGDFGSGQLDNSDVNNAFYASLGVHLPFSFTDAFDAMDAFPEDSADAVGGDGQIRYLDWQIILRRSLGLDPGVWQRQWSAAGARVAVAAPVRSAPSRRATLHAVLPGAVWSRPVQLQAMPREQVAPGSWVDVPVVVHVAPGASLAGLQFAASVAAGGGAPPLDEAAAFVPADAVPRPRLAPTASGNEVACGWDLGSFGEPLHNDVALGSIRFRVPAQARPGASYAVAFSHADGAPDLATQFDFETREATVWVQASAPAVSSVIPAEWKTHFFGDAQSPQAADAADPDGDGASNLEEYRAGTDPKAPGSRLRLMADSMPFQPAGASARLRWLSAPGKRYGVERASDLARPDWQAMGTEVLGDGRVMEISDPVPGPGPRFYRIRVLP